MINLVPYLVLFYKPRIGLLFNPATLLSMMGIERCISVWRAGALQTGQYGTNVHHPQRLQNSETMCCIRDNIMHMSKNVYSTFASPLTFQQFICLQKIKFLSYKDSLSSNCFKIVGRVEAVVSLVTKSF